MKSERDETKRFQPKYNERGLIPAIAQDHETGQVLMMAWMNEEALEATRESGHAHYWSRSRDALWKKGESSGNIQIVKNIKIDCDQDTILLLIEQNGSAACHTGRKTCFYRSLPAQGPLDDSLELIFDKE